MFRHLTSLSLLLSLSACWDLPDDDAGDRAYVTWATTAILGRGPVSPGELSALMDLEQRHGREALLDTLMQQPEFIDHWDDLLMQQLQVRTRLDASEEKEHCYTDAYVPPSYDYALSHHLRTADWDERFCVTSESASDDLTFSTGGRTAGQVTEEYTGRSITSGPSTAFTTKITTSRTSRALKPKCFEFTMKDVVRASLRTDRMDALLRAQLATLAAFESPVESRRRVFDAYFNRHQDCLECHTTTYSTTNGVPRNGNWDRYVPAVTEVDLEFSAFRSVDADGTFRDGSLGGDPPNKRFRNLFNGVQGTENEPGIHPWGFDEICMQNGILENPRPNDGNFPYAGWGDTMGEQVRILDFVDVFDDGLRAMVDGSASTENRSNFEGLGSANEEVLSTCNICHESAGDADGMLNGYPVPGSVVDLTETMTAERIRFTIQNGSSAGQMEAQGGDIEAIVSYLVSQQPTPIQVYSNPPDAMAHLTALSFVDGVAEHLSGKSLTLAHGFPRNADQALALRTLSDGLVENDWSLRYVIKRIAMSELVNRNAPAASSEDPYVLPMILDPWQDTPAPNDADPMTGIARNGQGELVHRWPVPTLLRKRAAALGWPQQTHFDGEGFRADLGGYVDFETPGFSSFGLGSALAWEDAVWSDELSCVPPGGVTVDVIDTLTDEGSDLTLTQALKALKFRMLGSERFWGDAQDGLAGLESNQISEIWNVDLWAPASDHPEVVRDYCAVLLSSPQFVFAGLPLPETDPPDIDLTIPCMDEECSEVGWCERYRYTAVELGYDSWNCYTAGGGIGGLSD